MAQVKTKKAKLAHEKGKRGAEGEKRGRSFAVHRVVELTDKGAVVELDVAGTMAIIDSLYVTKDAQGNLAIREIAVPATYDAIARKKAIDLYAAANA